MYMKKKNNNRNAVPGELMTRDADAYATGKQIGIRKSLTVERGVVKVPRGRAARVALYVVDVVFEQQPGLFVRGQRQRRLSRVRGQARIGPVTEQQPHQTDVAVFHGLV